jgi:acetyl-CoA carboxylase biotin carboxyl carrier protein
MDLERVKGLMDILANSSVRELRLVEAGVEIFLKRDRLVVPDAGPPHVAVAGPASNDASHEVRSPLPGVFYRAGAPGAEPFVHLGSVVKTGDTVAFVEAMKTMLAVVVECDGEITAILAENEAHVEAGQTLYRVSPSVR